MLKNIIFLLSLGCILNYCVYAAYTRFTNIKCEAYDKPFADFKECQLKVLGRGIIGMSLHVRLYKVPVNNVTMNISLYKKYNGYRPFMFNYTLNFCKEIANKNGPYSFAKLFLNIVLKNSNINHTCPYDHDIIVKDLVFLEEFLTLAPFPSGEYKFQIKVAAYNDWKAAVNVYLLRNE